MNSAMISATMPLSQWYVAFKQLSPDASILESSRKIACFCRPSVSGSERGSSGKGALQKCPFSRESRVAIALASRRGANLEIPGRAPGSVPGVLWEIGVLGRCSRRCSGKLGVLQGVLLRVLFLLNAPHWLRSTPCMEHPQVSVSTPQSTPISQSTPRSTSRRTSRYFPVSNLVPGQGDCKSSEFRGILRLESL